MEPQKENEPEIIYKYSRTIEGKTHVSNDGKTWVDLASLKKDGRARLKKPAPSTKNKVHEAVARWKLVNNED